MIAVAGGILIVLIVLTCLPLVIGILSSLLQILFVPVLAAVSLVIIGISFDVVGYWVLLPFALFSFWHIALKLKFKLATILESNGDPCTQALPLPLGIWMSAAYAYVLPSFSELGRMNKAVKLTVLAEEALFHRENSKRTLLRNAIEELKGIAFSLERRFENTNRVSFDFRNEGVVVSVHKNEWQLDARVEWGVRGAYFRVRDSAAMSTLYSGSELKEISRCMLMAIRKALAKQCRL